MKIFVISTILLAGCASGKITVIDRGVSSTMSEAVYAHKLSVDAYALTANASADCYARATTELGLAICGLSAKSGGTASVPQYIAPPTFLDRAAQFAPMVLGVGQLVASDRANARQTDASVQLAGINARRELGIVQAATGSNERIATTGFTAVANTSGIGFTALSGAATSANATTIAVTQSWVNALTRLPPSTQIIAGRDVIQARDVDQSVTGRNRVTGDGNELERNVTCVAQGGNGAPATTAAASGSSSTTSPISLTHNPLVNGGDGAPATNNCGGG